MARRKKYQKLPNGYGSIRFLGSGRRNPYGVYPPVKEFDDNGNAVSRKAICSKLCVFPHTFLTTWLYGILISEQGLYPGGEPCFRRRTDRLGG